MRASPWKGACMLRALVNAAQRWWDDFAPAKKPAPRELLSPGKSPTAPSILGPLEKIVLTDGVCRTLFEEYSEHRQGKRGDEETGWVLMGQRHEREAIALATLPAGAAREAGVAHV